MSASARLDSSKTSGTDSSGPYTNGGLTPSPIQGTLYGVSIPRLFVRGPTLSSGYSSQFGHEGRFGQWSGTRSVHRNQDPSKRFEAAWSCNDKTYPRRVTP